MRQIIKTLGLVGFVIILAIWLALALVVAGLYAPRTLGAESTQVDATPLDNLTCPLFLTGQPQTIHAGIPEATGEPLIFQVTFNVIPADVSTGFQTLCAPKATAAPFQLAPAACQINGAALQPKGSRAWFLHVFALPVDAAQSGDTYLDSTYTGRCLLRPLDAFAADTGLSLAVLITGLGIALWGLALWPDQGALGRVIVLLSLPVIWLAASYATSLAMAAMVTWQTFLIVALIFGGVVALVGWRRVRRRLIDSLHAPPADSGVSS